MICHPLILFLSVPPTIAPFQWTPIEAGHRTSKTCQVPTGDLPIRITWYWNGKIINNNNGVSIDNKDFLSHLLFSEVKAEHRGRYTCKAENKAGSTSYSEELVVQGKNLDSQIGTYRKMEPLLTQISLHV